MINGKSAVIHVKLCSCYTSRRERTLRDRKTCPFLEWESSVWSDGLGRWINRKSRAKNNSLRARTVCWLRCPTTVTAKATHSRRKQITHGKNKSRMAKASRSRQKQIHSRQREINWMPYSYPAEYTNLGLVCLFLLAILQFADLLLPWAICFCRERICFCRELFAFAAGWANLLLPWQLWATVNQQMVLARSELFFERDFRLIHRPNPWPHTLLYLFDDVTPKKGMSSDQEVSSPFLMYNTSATWQISQQTWYQSRHALLTSIIQQLMSETQQMTTNAKELMKIANGLMKNTCDLMYTPSFM